VLAAASPTQFTPKSAALFRIEPRRNAMHRRFHVSAIVALTTVAAASAVAAQSQISRSLPLAAAVHIQVAQQGAIQAPAPPKPYKPIPITAPAPANDPSFDAFRKQLADIAKRKDRTGLAKIVVAQGFFWEGESGDKADKKKTGIDNLAAATGLDGKEDFGWDTIGAAAQEPTLEPYVDRKGVMCGPASPQFDEKALDETTKATETDMSEWGFPTKAGLEVRGAAQPNAPVVDKLGLNLVRVMPEEPAAGSNQPPNFMRIVTPAGKVGFVPADAIAPVTADQMCFQKDAGGWKIAGYIGGQ
jgi:hypothetical protein